MRKGPSFNLVIASFLLACFACTGSASAQLGVQIQRDPHSIEYLRHERAAKALGYPANKVMTRENQVTQKAGPTGLPQQGIPNSVSPADSSNVPGITVDYQHESQNMEAVPQDDTITLSEGWVEHAPNGPALPIDNATTPLHPFHVIYPPVINPAHWETMEQKAAKDTILGSAVRYGGKPGTETFGEISTQLEKLKSDMGFDPKAAFDKGQSGMHGAAQGASEAVADAFNPTWLAMLELQMSNLLNVANEASGSPSSAMAPTKSYSNAIWFVQRMYSEVYVPMAILFLLPGAVLTQMKGYVSFGILSSSSDEDAVSPFVGILRAMVAIFLIPGCQLITSYTIDVGNSLTHEVRQHVNPLTIYRWADEQVFRAPDSNAKDTIMNPNIFPVLGKLTQGPEKLSGVESQSTATVMLQTLANSMAESAAMGLVMLCAFQITMICYLMLLGPLAASFYAWPSGLGNLFNKVFSTWVDAVVNLSLWRFWWTVVLLCIDTRLGWLGAMGGYNLFSEWELLMFIAFLTILTYVPFNPFDFQAGEMVSQLMQKAESAVSESSKK